MTVCLAAFALGTVGWLVTTQISSLLRELPKYSQNVKDKVKSLKKVATSSNQLTKMIVDFNQELGSQPTSKSDAANDDLAENETQDRTGAADRRRHRSTKPRSGCRGFHHFWHRSWSISASLLWRSSWSFSCFKSGKSCVIA